MQQNEDQQHYNILKDIWDKLDSMDSKWDKRMSTVETQISVLQRFRIQALMVGAFVVFITTLFKDYVITRIFGRGS